MCASWIEGQNSSPGYGNVMALPAQQVYTTCSNATSSSDNDICQSSLEVNTTAVTNFWSTNTLDTESGSAASRLLLQAGVQDGLGQVVTAGLYMRYAITTAQDLLAVAKVTAQEKSLSAYRHGNSMACFSLRFSSCFNHGLKSYHGLSFADCNICIDVDAKV